MFSQEAMVRREDTSSSQIQIHPATQLSLLAPLSGPVIPIEKVPDPVFSQKLMGNGIAIDPISTALLAPCPGRIVQLHPAHHAVSIEADGGVQVLLHIGIDTVKLKGEGFTPKVKVGDQVKVGQTLINFDADVVATKAKSLISIMVIAEAPPYQLTTPAGTFASAGKDVLLKLDFQGLQKKAGVAKGERAESRGVEVTLPTGLHARPAALVVNHAKRYQSNIELRKGKVSANAKSLVSILSLEVLKGDFVQFLAEGSDAKIAVQELAAFLKNLKEQPEPEKKPESSKPSVSSDAGVIMGIGASPGLALGRVHQLRSESLQFNENAPGSTSEERSRLTKALQAASAELDDLLIQLTTKTNAAQAAIFAAHLELLEDPTLIELADGQLAEGKSAPFAWNHAISTHADRLAHLNNELMANRANDLRDVGRRVLRLLVGPGSAKVSELPTNSILVAENLTPSDTVQLDREKVLGFCTTTGGATSHVAILARSLGIPAVAGIDRRALEVPEGAEVVLDGDRGELRLNPSAGEKQLVLQHQAEQLERRKQALSLSLKPAVTRDGVTVEVAANIGGVEDARKAVELGCDGVGLLRSEFLFLERETAPSEDEQYRVYQEIADVLGERPLTIRTLDVGGDKPLQYLPIPAEENPFLGVRGIRVGFLRPEILREQLRAILRVKSRGKINVMFPMISTLDEFIAARAMLEEERKRLGAPPVQLGIMIEVPSAALLAEAFAKECDFFSIGTNDLTQYTLAMDRGHKDLAKQVDGLHPSVLRLIDMTVQAARKYKRWVGVCGGIASDQKAVPILLGLGVEELSVSIPVIPLVKSQVRETSLAEAKLVAVKALSAPGAKEVREL